MAVRTAHVTLCYFCLNGSPGEMTFDHFGYRHDLCPTDVVKLEEQCFRFTAINAGMLQQICLYLGTRFIQHYPIAELSLGNVACPVGEVVLLNNRPMTWLAVWVEVLLPSSPDLSVKLRKRLCFPAVSAHLLFHEAAVFH